MAVGDIYKATAIFNGVGDNERNWVWKYRQVTGTDPDTTALIAAIAAMLLSAWGDIDANIADAVVGVILNLAKWDNVNKQYDTIETADISSLVGTAPAEAMPGNVAPYVTFPTDIGRSRGKKFIFDVIEAVVDNGINDVLFLADLATFAAAFNNIVSDGDATYRPGNYNEEKNTFHPWSTTVVGVGLLSGSQYRRIVGIGA